MVDASYQPKVYMRQGGDVQVVANGGQMLVEEGGQIVVGEGAKQVSPTVLKGADYTVLASESGTTFIVTAADVKLTLPATAAGLRYTFIVKTLSTTTGCQLSPVAADKILGNGFAGTDDKDAINTAATDVVGDMMTLIGDGVDGWLIENLIGTWALE